jgi:hypothetical protein
MTIHYSKFKLNTYAVTPYFAAHVEESYPLDRVLITSRTYRRLPPNLKKLAALAKRWTIRKYPWHPAGMYDIENYYDDQGYELNPATGERLTDKEIENDWERVLSSSDDDEDFKVEDIPVPAGGFADPDTWEEPPVKPIDTADSDALREDDIVRDIKSHGREYVAKDYGVPADWLPRIRDDRHLARTIVRMRKSPSG